MASSRKHDLLNFFGMKNSRKHILICIRCGSDSIDKKENLIICKECDKILSIKH
ncbi:MAG: hypothetical protein KGH89_06810 [Thaumarchaeota archaeon]|nr:hypothetical protein [Nitrososphaerota archaeon]